MKVLIVGADGQLGRELQYSAPQWAEVVSYGRKQLDITRAAAVHTALSDLRPDAVINAAAYTHVDQAESYPKQAYAVNEVGARNLALAAAEVNARYLLVSTDFVFYGQQGSAYRRDAAPCPQGVYGASKRAGELAALSVAAANTPDNTIIMRTSWLYSAHGGNFVNSMLALMRDKPDLGVVVDQIGAPTWAKGLAQALWRSLEHPTMHGVFHYCDAGVASWYDFAHAVQEQALTRGLLERRIPIAPLTTSEFPRPAPRPAFSVLDSRDTWDALGITPQHWRGALGEMLDEVAAQQTSSQEKAYA